MGFKGFSIKACPNNDKRWSLEKTLQNGCSFVVGWLEWDEDEEWFEFRGCGTRIFKYEAEGLGAWVEAWCSLTRIEMMSEVK